jgi:hypothetical protein
VDRQLDEDVLDVGASGLRADDEGLGDPIVIRSLAQEGEDLAFPTCQMGDSPIRRVALLPASQEGAQQGAQHSRRHQGFAAVDGPGRFDEIRERCLLGQKPRGALVEHLDQTPVVLVRPEHEDPTLRHSFGDMCARMSAASDRQADVDDRDVGRCPFCLADGLRAVAGLTDDDKIRLCLESGPDGLPEQRLLVREQYPDQFGAPNISVSRGGIACGRDATWVPCRAARARERIRRTTNG